VTRSAQIALAAGSVDEAIRKFEYAAFINAKMHRAFLTGDAARRYIEALSRVRKHKSICDENSERGSTGEFRPEDC
jgi:hypothetical protein